jgi:hypothetical protein
MEHEAKKTIKTEGRKLLLDALKLFGISQSDGVPNYRGIFELGPNKIKYSTYRHSRKENL